MGHHFMYNDSYEHIALQEDFIDNPKFLKESMNVEVLYHAQKEIPLVMELPASIEVEITYTEPGLKGDTATNATKPATIETGAEIRVPLFINEGDKVRVDTKTGAYMERVIS